MQKGGENMKYTKSIFLGLVTLLFVSTPVLAATFNVDFESFSLGNINGQSGWSKTGPYDAEVVSNTFAFPTFGSQSLRISNGIASGSFGDQTFSASLADEAGETDAQPSAYSGGTRQNHFEAQFDVASTTPEEQPGLFISISPDRGDGARMGYVGLDDEPDGIHVIFYDYQDRLPYGSLAIPADGCSGDDNWYLTDLATLDRSTTHTIKITMDLVDGPRNDVVKVYVDGDLKHTGTTWEDYFRWCTESGGGVINDTTADVSRTVDSLLFRAGGSSVPSVLGKGYLIDNLTLYSGPAISVPTDKQSCKKGGWMTFNSPVFKNQGDCVSFIQSNENAVANKTK